MPESNILNIVIYCLIGIIAIFFFIMCLIAVGSFFYDFSQELKRLNCEIRRREEPERSFWIRRRRRLWLSLIPFVRY